MSSTSAIDAARRRVHLEHLGAVAPAVAVGAAQVDVGEELHLDVLEAVAAAGRAAAVAGVEAERALRVAALLRERRRPRSACGSRRTRRRSSPDSSASCGRSATGRPARRRRSCSAPRARDARPAPRSACPSRLQQRRVQHVLHQRRLAGARHAGDADEPLQRDGDVDVLQVVLGGAEQLDALGASHRPRRARRRLAATRLRPAR